MPVGRIRAMHTLLDRFEVAAARPGGRVVFVQGEEHVPVSWAELHDDARRMAAELQEGLGISSGAHVALLGATSRELVTAIQAVILAGATVVVLPLPMRMASVEEFVEQTRRRLRRADTDLLVADGLILDSVDVGEVGIPLVRLEDLAERSSRRTPDEWDRPRLSPDDLAVLQFTSGSTSDPKGVMLPHRTITANLDAIAVAAELDIEGDVLVSWLPLYHDMGLIGLLCVPMTTGCDLVLGAPQDFMARPIRWMEWISRYGGTATAGPNFAWAVTTRSLRRSERLDLSRLRVALSGAEPVDPATVREFVRVAGEHGMRPEAVFPAFGMAEVAIAGTFPEPLTGLRTDTVDRKVLETEGLAVPTGPGPQTKELARLGRPVPGLEIRICDPETGRERSEREVGELEIRGTSVTPGYYGDPEATARAFRGEWLRTGDLGYLVDGELVICGRMKDVIIVGGRNVFPEDIERAAARVEGVRAGNVIAFGVEDSKGRERIVVVAETKEQEVGDIPARVVREVLAGTGETVREVVLLAPGSLPKTSSGKLQRDLTKRRYLSGELESFSRQNLSAVRSS